MDNTSRSPRSGCCSFGRGGVPFNSVRFKGSLQRIGRACLSGDVSFVARGHGAQSFRPSWGYVPVFFISLSISLGDISL